MGNNYLEVSLVNALPETREIISALISNEGIGVAEENNIIKAYAEQNTEEEQKLNRILDELKEQFPIQSSIKIIPAENWNRQWESNFKPVIVDDFCTVRASFHEKNMNTEHEIIIDPKMSFGTGHHATTFMMLSLMKNIDFAQKDVLDFGCGSGILAIMAHKLQAKSVYAIDNEEWAYRNTLENIQTNNTQNIVCFLGDEEALKGLSGKYDIVLANITKNVILENFNLLTDILKPSGLLVISGFLIQDEPDLMNTAKDTFTLQEKLNKDNWSALRLLKTSL